MLEIAGTSVDLLSVAIGLALGAAVGGYLYRTQSGKNHELVEKSLELTAKLGLFEQRHLEQQHVSDKMSEQLEQLREEQLNGQGELGQLRQKAVQLQEMHMEKHQLQQELANSQQHNAQLNSQIEAQNTRLEQQQHHHQEKIILLQQAEERLQQQFENLANRIFEQKNENFRQTSQQGLNHLLSPLKEQIEGFKKQITDQYVKEGQERASLKTEIMGLKELNRQITEDAAALTKALKGDNKQQGNWGEVILERILNESGLREGHEYDTQGQFKDEQGKAFKPDVIVHLPQNKDVIIDSKVSLSAYEQYFNQQDDSLREQHLSEHIQSLRHHIKGLGKKDYQNLTGIRTLDYVLMFIPVEPAFLLAIDKAPDLIKLALDNNIMLVSPTNLLVALRTINNIWQYEYQNQNAQDIAKKAAAMYDKFQGFASDMLKLGDNISTLDKRYDEAMKKLSRGRGNLVRKAEEFKTLGVQSSKKIDAILLEQSEEEPSEGIQAKMKWRL